MIVSSPDATLRKSKTGDASLPLTATLAITTPAGGGGKPRFAAKAAISSAVPGSWEPNWLQGKARITRPRAAYV